MCGKFIYSSSVDVYAVTGFIYSQIRRIFFFCTHATFGFRSFSTKGGRFHTKINNICSFLPTAS